MRHKIIYTLLALFVMVFFSQKCMAQQTSWTDSLQSILSSNVSDSSKVSLLGTNIIFLTTNAKTESKDFLASMEKLLEKSEHADLLAELYYSKAVVWGPTAPISEIFGYIDSCLYFANKTKNTRFLIRGHRMKGQYYERTNQITEAALHLDKAYEYCKTANIPVETYRTLLALSFFKQKQNDFKAVIAYAILAADVADKNALSSTLGSVYLRIAKGYQRIADSTNALLYYQKAEEYSVRLQQGLLPELYSNLGNFYQTFKMFDKAMASYFRCDSAMQAQNSYLEAVSVYANIATLYTLNDDLDAAKIYFGKSVAVAEQTNNKYLGRIYLNYSNFLLKKGDDSLALEYANKAIIEAKEKEDLEAVPEAMQAKAAALIEMKQYPEAVILYQQAIVVKDSVNDLLKQESLGELLAKYESEKKENEITKLNSDKKIQQLQLEKQKALLAGNFLEAKQKQQEIDLLNQHQQIQELKLKQQHETLALKELESEANNRKLKITEQANQLNEAKLKQQIASKQIIIGSAVVILAFILLGFNQYRLNMHRKSDNERYQLQNQLSEMKVEALRSQMNPHFIFNALNSINRYIIRNNKETASEYLIKFSKLMRMILENSKSSSITLEEEMEALRLYVEMELLRFENKFDFQVDIDKSINKAKVKIPPLVLQPFVENAIWHGLMNKKDRGNIAINIKPKADHKLFVSIEDNGVGRLKANELKNSIHQGGKSFGMEITKARIKTLNSNDKNFRIIDLYDNMNDPAGTRVEIELNTQIV